MEPREEFTLASHFWEALLATLIHPDALDRIGNALDSSEADPLTIGFPPREARAVRTAFPRRPQPATTKTVDIRLEDPLTSPYHCGTLYVAGGQTWVCSNRAAVVRTKQPPLGFYGACAEHANLSPIEALLLIKDVLRGGDNTVLTRIELILEMTDVSLPL